MIKSDRKALRRAALAALIFGIMFLFLLVDLGLQVFTGQAAHQNILLLLLLLILFLFVMVWIGFVLFRFRRVNKRRTRALQGDQSLLAASQPVPDQNALSLPTTIQFRLRRGYSMAMLGIISVVVLVWIYSSNGSPFSLTPPVLASRLAIALGQFLIVTVVITVVIYLERRIQMEYDLEVNELGLSVIHGNVRTAVNWSEARLFAVNDPKKPKRPKVYELATSETVARWMWLPPGRTFFSALEPTLPLEEYHHKMQAVLQLIEAKTHLPLYDIGPSKAK
jgi:membrane protein YdbS with pleckstrin-like domain